MFTIDCALDNSIQEQSAGHCKAQPRSVMATISHPARSSHLHDVDGLAVHIDGVGVLLRWWHKGAKGGTASASQELYASVDVWGVGRWFVGYAKEV